MSGVKEELARRASNIKESDKKETQNSNSGTCRSDNEELSVRLLRADEIECRVSTINERGLSLLLYKDARVDQKILDETFTPFGWKRTHQIIDGNLYCTVEIWDAGKCQWIAKQDVGTTSYSEKEKGQASDSFKRACFNWGLGRELYTAPFIWIPAEKVSIQKKDNKYVTYDRFYVRSIAYNEQREIVELTVVNGKGYLVFELSQGSRSGRDARSDRQTKSGRESGMGQQTKPESKPKQESKARQQSEPGQQAMTAQEETGVTDQQMEVLEKELERTGIPAATVLARYQIDTIEQMTPEIYTKALNGLKKTKTKVAA